MVTSKFMVLHTKNIEQHIEKHYEIESNKNYFLQQLDISEEFYEDRFFPCIALQKQTDLKNDLHFEDAIERLEKIIEKMENERVPLEEMLKDYEEGTKLLSVCKEKISIARKKVEKINKDLNKDAPKLDELDEIAD